MRCQLLKKIVTLLGCCSGRHVKEKNHDSNRSFSTDLICVSMQQNTKRDFKQEDDTVLPKITELVRSNLEHGMQNELEEIDCTEQHDTRSQFTSLSRKSDQIVNTSCKAKTSPQLPLSCPLLHPTLSSKSIAEKRKESDLIVSCNRPEYIFCTLLSSNMLHVPVWIPTSCVAQTKCNQDNKNIGISSVAQLSSKIHTDDEESIVEGQVGNLRSYNNQCTKNRIIINVYRGKSRLFRMCCSQEQFNLQVNQYFNLQHRRRIEHDSSSNSRYSKYHEPFLDSPLLQPSHYIQQDLGFFEEKIFFEDSSWKCLKTDSVVSKRAFRNFVRSNMSNREDPLLSPKSLEYNLELNRFLPIESYTEVKKTRLDYNRRYTHSKKQGWSNETIRSMLPKALVQNIVRESLACKYIKCCTDFQRSTSWFNPLFLQEPPPTPLSTTRKSLHELLEEFRLEESDLNIVHLESTYIKKYMSTYDTSFI